LTKPKTPRTRTPRTRTPKHFTSLELPVYVLYKVLPGLSKDGEPWLPEQIDLIAVVLKKKERTRNILPMLQESVVLSIEDEIAETLSKGE